MQSNTRTHSHTHSLLSALSTVAPPSIIRTFERMEIAEEVIREAFDSIYNRNDIAHSDKDAQLAIVESSFIHLCPRIDLSHTLYRLHCREIIDRLLTGGGSGCGSGCGSGDDYITPYTDAELMMLFSDASLECIMHRQFNCAFDILFSRLLPDEYAKIEPSHYDSYETEQALELIEHTRTKRFHEQTQRARSTKRADPSPAPALVPPMPVTFSADAIAEILRGQ